MLYMLATVFNIVIPSLWLGQEGTGGGPGTSTAYQSVIQLIGGVFSEANLVTVLTYAITGALILVFFWWAVRKCWKILSKAFFRGKLRF